MCQGRSTPYVGDGHSYNGYINPYFGLMTRICETSLEGISQLIGRHSVDASSMDPTAGRQSLLDEWGNLPQGMTGEGSELVGECKSVEYIYIIILYYICIYYIILHYIILYCIILYIHYIHSLFVHNVFKYSICT